MANLRKIPHLQTLRAVAASLVVAEHAMLYPIRRHILPEDYQNLAWALGWLGVSTFFVISGLIMVRSSTTEFGDHRRAQRFAMRRLIRIVPLYWLAILPFAAAAIARGEQVRLDMVVKTMLFIPYHSAEQNAIRPIIGQGWTLNYEILFYVVFAACLLLRRRIGLPVLLAFFPVVVAIRSALSPLIPYSDPTTPLLFWTDPITVFFSVGMVIGLVELSQPRWHSIAYPTLWTIFVLGTCLWLFLIGGGSFPMPIWWQALFAGSAALAVLVCTSDVSTRFSTLSCTTEALGDASYSTYIIHPLILMGLAAIWARLPIIVQSPTGFIMTSVIVCNLAGYACYRLIERPMTNRLRGLIDGKRPVQLMPIAEHT